MFNAVGNVFTQREQMVTAYWVQGEFLDRFRTEANTIMGPTRSVAAIGPQTLLQGSVADIGRSEVDLHSMTLLASMLTSTAFADAVPKSPDLLKLVFDRNLYYRDSQNDQDPNFIDHLYIAQASNATTPLLDRFAADISKLAPSVGGTTSDPAMQKSLLVAAMDYYYYKTPSAATSVFNAGGGAVNFDLADIGVASNSLKSAARLAAAAAALAGNAAAAVESAAGAMTQWHVQAGATAMNWNGIGTNDDVAIGGTAADSLAGGDGNDLLLGLGGADLLQGGTGADILVGGDGADTLDGGSGPDYLYGGAGADTYNLSGSFGGDWLIDSDGQGTIKVDGTALIGGKLIAAGSGTYKDAASGWFYTVAGTDLIILKDGSVNQIRVRDWQAGQLGITLDQTVVPVTTANTYTGDFIKKTDVSDLNMYLISGANYVNGGSQLNAADVINGSTAADSIQGAGGNDALAGLAGDDIIDGGAGDDILFGGAGRDTLTGGAGKDFIYGSGTGGLTLPLRTTDAPIAAGGPEYTRGFSWVTFDGGTEANGVAAYRINGADASTVTSDLGNVIDGGDGDDWIRAGSGLDVVHGGADNDDMEGLDGGDIMFGDDGNDRISGDGIDLAGYVETVPGVQHGNDVIDGGSGNDTLSGQGGDDELYGGLGNDSIYGDDTDAKFTPLVNHGNDYLDGGDGADMLVGGGRDDELFGGTGADSLFGDGDTVNLPGGYHGNDYLDGEEGNDYLEGGGASDTLFGGSGSDVLWGDSTGTMLAGSFHGADYLDGEAGNDTLVGGGQADQLFGGDDDDVLFGDDDTATLGASAQGADYLDGEEGNDYLQGDGNNDTLIGGNGKDSLRGDSSDSSFPLSSNGNDYLQGDAGDDQLTGGGGDDTLDGGSDNDVLLGDDQTSVVSAAGHGDDWLDGGLGDDALYGGGGSDYLSGGDGNDWLAGEDQVSSTSLSNLTGDDTLYGGEGDDTLVGGNGSDLLFGEGGNDKLYGSGADALYGGGGEDYLYAGAGGSFLDGGAGNDTLLGGNGGDTLLGGAGNDLIQDQSDSDSSPYAHTIDGGEGNDTILAGWGSDEIQGGAGDDYIVINHGSVNKNIHFGIGKGRDIVDNRANPTTGAQFSFDFSPSETGISFDQRTGQVRFTLSDGSSIEIDNFVSGDFSRHCSGLSVKFADGGNWVFNAYSSVLVDILKSVLRGPVASDLSDYLPGTSAADVISGGGGNDWIYGGAGDDILNGGDGEDNIFGGSGNDTLSGGGRDRYASNLRGGLGSDVYVHEDIRGAVTNIDESNSSSDIETIVLASGIDASEVDVIEADMGDGTPRYLDLQVHDGYATHNQNFSSGVSISNFFELQNDWVVQFSDGSRWSKSDLIFKATHKIGSGVDDLIRGAVHLSNVIDGLAGNDYLSGGGDADTLNGGSGADTLFGGAGGDTYVVDDEGDKILYEQDSWSGSTFFADPDTVESSITWTLGDALEDLTLTGSAAIDGHGNQLDNFLTGNAGANTLDGGDGNDTLDGGAGNDFLSGGHGDNIYLFGRGDGQDYLAYSNDATPERRNTLQMKSGVASADLRLSRVGDELIVGIAGALDTLRVQQFFYGDSPYTERNPLQQIRFADGTVWDAATISGLLTNNHAPVLVTAIVDRAVVQGEPFAFTLPQGSFTDPDASDVLFYSAQLANGQALPSWLVFDAATSSFSGNSASAPVGLSSIRVTATDKAGLSVNDVFDLTVQVPNNIPVIVNGTPGNDTLTATNVPSTLYGNGGNDTFIGGNGDDLLASGGIQGLHAEYFNNTTWSGTPALVREGETVDFSWEGSPGAGVNADYFSVRWTGQIEAAVSGNYELLWFADDQMQVMIDGQTIIYQTGYTGAVAGTTVNLSKGSHSIVAQMVDGEQGASARLHWKAPGDTEFAAVPLTSLSSALHADAQADTFNAGAGNDTLVGSLAKDSMTGGSGDDTYYVDNADDLVVENAGQGNDTVLASTGYALTSNVENLVLIGTAKLEAAGNSGDNVLRANGAGNTLHGNGGSDTFIGGNGDDLLASGGIQGLHAEYFNNTTWSGTPALVREGETVDFSWEGSPGAGVNADYFSVRWTGQLEAAVTGSYELLWFADDQMQVMIDGQTIINQTGYTGAISGTSVNLGKGSHSIVAQMVEGEGGASARLHWKAPGDTEFTAVPLASLSSAWHPGLDASANDNASFAADAQGDIFDGGAGNDILMGSRGDDTYRWGLGKGTDTITDAGGSMDRVDLFAGITRDQLLFSRHGDALELQVTGQADKLVVNGWYGASSGTSRIEEFRLGNGDKVLGSEVESLVTAMAQFSASASPEVDSQMRSLPAWRSQELLNPGSYTS